MSIRSFSLLVTLTFIAFIIAACSNGNDIENNAQNNVEEAPQVEEEENNNADNENNESEHDENQNEAEENNDETNTATETTTNENSALPDPIEINERIIHPNGVTLILESITFEEDYISVNFNAENASGYFVSLALEGASMGGNLGGITLKDDTGYAYRYVAEEGASLELKKEERVTGTASFLGRLEDDAKSLTLIFNDEDYATEDDPFDIAPKFVFPDIEIKR